MTSDRDLNARGNVDGHFTQGVGGWAEYTVMMTETSDTVRHDVRVPPGKVIPVIFLPGVMGSNLRMTRSRQEELKRNDNRSWRPDDMVTVSGKACVVSGTGLGGWFKNASPAQRQLNFDPDETEVEFYHYSSDPDRFDPDSKEAAAADARHKNVPDSLNAIPPLMGTPSLRTPSNSRGQGSASPAQIARWRGWSEVMFSGPYGEMLRTAERVLNNMLDGEKIHAFWRTTAFTRLEAEQRILDPCRGVMDLLLGPPKAFGASTGDPITEDTIRQIAACWYPVHAMGYNYLKSNGESAKEIADRIRGLVAGYQKRHFKCDEVIIVTHSMGGILARALIHPSYGNLLADPAVRVLGMYHSVMPTAGAAAAYKRMRFGFAERTSWLAEMEAKLFGIDGKHATAILANTPGPLELLPAQAYGANWLQLVTGIGEPVASWPPDGSTALETIYLLENRSWWRLLNPDWVNPAVRKSEAGGGLKSYHTRIRAACHFSDSIQNSFHPTSSWVSYCASAQRLSYGQLRFAIMDIDVYGPQLRKMPPAHTWRLLSEDGRGKMLVQAGARKLTLQLVKPRDKGDETVPATLSAALAKGHKFVHGKDDEGYEHQGSYSDEQVMAAMLYSIVQMARSAKWK